MPGAEKYNVMGFKFLKDVEFGIVIEFVISCLDILWNYNNENGSKEKVRGEFMVVWNHIPIETQMPWNTFDSHPKRFGPRYT